MTRQAKLTLLGLVFAICAGAALVQNFQHHTRQATKPGELFDVVWRQIVAVRDDDFAGAYQQVSLEFQERFNIEAFADLARTDYHPALRYADRVEFGAVKWDGRQAVVPVYFFLPTGEVVPCFYHLVHEGDAWKIDGVHVRKRWPAGRRLGGVRA